MLGILTNKHMVVAMIVAPILAVLSWFAVDAYVSEKPQAIKAGESYPLRARSNCRYTSGECGLVNADFESAVTIEAGPDGRVLELKSNLPLDAAQVGFAPADGDNVRVNPVALVPLDEQRQHWRLAVPSDAPRLDDSTKMFIAMSSQGAKYYGETVMAFTEKIHITGKEYSGR